MLGLRKTSPAERRKSIDGMPAQRRQIHELVNSKERKNRRGKWIDLRSEAMRLDREGIADTEIVDEKMIAR